jgi:branched-chain amino acid transport system substrate-binding protein
MLKGNLVRTLIVSLALAVAVLALSCEEENSDDPEATEAAPTDAAPGATGTPPENILTAEDVLRKDGSATGEDTVRWGSMFELSGGVLSGFGQPNSDGVLLAVDEINKAGGFQVGDTVYTIELVERDTRSTVEQAIAIAQELVRDEEVNVIFGPATVGEPEATPITQGQEVLHLCPCQEREVTALSSVEKAEGESHWAFQTLLPFSLLIDNGARNFVEDYPDIQSTALLCQNTATGQDVCGRTADAYRNQGLDVVAEEYFPPGTSDYSPYLTEIRSEEPDQLFIFENPPNDAQVVRRAIELGVGEIYNGVVVPASLLEGLVGLGPLEKPVIVGASPRQHAEPTSPAAAEYFDRYAAFKGVELSGLPPAAFTSLLMYDYVYMLIAAMQEAGTVEDTTAIADALEDVHYKGVAEDDMFFNSRHLGVHGTDPCTVLMSEITCEHIPAPEEAKQ